VHHLTIVSGGNLRNRSGPRESAEQLFDCTREALAELLEHAAGVELADGEIRRSATDRRRSIGESLTQHIAQRVRRVCGKQQHTTAWRGDSHIDRDASGARRLADASFAAEHQQPRFRRDDRRRQEPASAPCQHALQALRRSPFRGRSPNGRVLQHAPQ
jgi:hypothetical protein